ncbi:MAG: RpiB/LacA/LacB family sugar-phosphate isomerase [Spirochaetota bacterium]
MKKKIIIGADRPAIPLKDAIKKHLIEDLGYEVSDVGMVDEARFVPYFETAGRVAKAIQNGDFERGILLCGTGAGMTLVANKYKGIRAIPATIAFEAKMCRAINDANVLCLGGHIVTPRLGTEMVDLFLTTEFKADFPKDRHEFLELAMKEIESIEAANFR